MGDKGPENTPEVEVEPRSGDLLQGDHGRNQNRPFEQVLHSQIKLAELEGSQGRAGHWEAVCRMRLHEDAACPSSGFSR